MLSWPPTVRIFLAAESTDMRKGFDSLAYLVESSMALDPVSGHLFVFRSRRGERSCCPMSGSKLILRLSESGRRSRRLPLSFEHPIGLGVFGLRYSSDGGTAPRSW
jgi:transposase